MISYVRGDATKPTGEGVKVIIHIVNSVGAWGAGFVLAISKRWMKPERLYKHLFSKDIGSVPRLGDVHVVQVEPDVFVVNMVAQNGLPSRNNPKPCDLPALRNCLMTLKHRLDASKTKVSIHMPAIGTGFGGRAWSEIEPIINHTVGLRYKVTVYSQEPLATKKT